MTLVFQSELLQTQIQLRSLAFACLLMASPILVETIHADSNADAILQAYPKLSPTPFGKGIFAHVRRPGGRIRSVMPVSELAKVPHVAGSQLSYTWPELEPSSGEYQWDVIERDLEVWAREGKKCWIEISTCNRRGVGEHAALATPMWIYEEGVPKIQGRSTAAYPVFWNKKYKHLWRRFIEKFGERYDGDPRLEFVSTGGYSSGHEPNLSSRDNGVLMSQWKAAGFDGMIVDGIYFREAIVPILDMYRHAFQKTPIAQTIHVKSQFDEATNQYAAKHGFVLLSNGMSVKVASLRGRQEWLKRKNRYKTKVGYAEWGPAGRRIRGRSAIATLEDVYHGVLGDESEPSLQPASRLSYLPLGQRIPSVETEAEWRAALQWAAEHLSDY